MRPTARTDLLGALLPIALFLDVAAHRLRATARPVTLTQWAFIAVVNAAVAGLTYCEIRRSMRSRRGDHATSAKAPWSPSREAKLTWLIVAAHCVAKVQYWDLVPRWDAATYFDCVVKASNTFTLSLDSLATNFRLAGHPSHAYGMYLAIGQMLFPSSHVVSNLQNVALTALGIFAFWALLRKLFVEWSPSLRLLVTAALAFNPLYFGTSLHTNSDLPVTVFLVAVLASFVHRRLVWFGFFGLCLCFSKEPGGMAYALILGLITLFYAAQRATSAAEVMIDLDELVCFPSEPHVALQRGPRAFVRSFVVFAVALLPLGVFYLYHRSVPKVSWTSSTSIWNDSGFLCFGLNSRMFRTVLGEALLLNFSWIPTVAVLSYFAQTQIGGSWCRSAPKTDEQRIVRILTYLFLVYLLIHCLYINFLNARYVLALVPIWLILGGYSLHHLTESHRFRLGGMAAFVALSVAQTWYALDPVSNAFWSTFKVGDRTVLHVGGDIAGDTQGMADGLVYNAQFVALERLYRGVNHFYLGRRPIPTLFFGSSHYWMIFYCLAPVRLDPVTLDFTTQPRDAGIGLIGVDELTPAHRFPNAVYIAMPWVEDPTASLKKLSRWYIIKENHRINYGDYYLDTYDLERRSD